MELNPDPHHNQLKFLLWKKWIKRQLLGLCRQTGQENWQILVQNFVKRWSWILLSIIINPNSFSGRSESSRNCSLSMCSDETGRNYWQILVQYCVTRWSWILIPIILPNLFSKRMNQAVRVCFIYIKLSLRGHIFHVDTWM